jgi:hypothetical protein
LSAWRTIAAMALIAPAAPDALAQTVAAEARPGYELLAGPSRADELRRRFTADQLALLEKLNRATFTHLDRLDVLVLPQSWDLDELAYSPLPMRSEWAAAFPKALIVHQAGQAFGAYEGGRLARWGPVSSGRRKAPTPAGIFHLNWRSPGRHSTVDPDWYMPWYFNFENDHGLALHQFTLPGRPASHACIRLLERDAKWLYEWGEGWVLDERGWEVVSRGTPLWVVGTYDYEAPPPWRSLEWLARGIDLPPAPLASALKPAAKPAGDRPDLRRHWRAADAAKQASDG